jgi:hypothetical protein
VTVHRWEKVKGERITGLVAKVIEHLQARYEVQEVEVGKVYRWRPENVLVECDCGERLTLTRVQSTCGRCSADHSAHVQQELEARQLKDEATHPWRSVHPYYKPTIGT